MISYYAINMDFRVLHWYSKFAIIYLVNRCNHVTDDVRFLKKINL